jgi:hypothetical protein
MAYNFLYLKKIFWLNKRHRNLKFDISTRVSLFHNALEMLQRRNQFEPTIVSLFTSSVSLHFVLYLHFFTL